MGAIKLEARNGVLSMDEVSARQFNQLFRGNYNTIGSLFDALAIAR